jgi:predicted acetyltransferase
VQLYQYDFSEFDGWRLDDDGRFSVVDWHEFFVRPRHVVYLIKVDGRIAGFAAAHESESFRDPDERVWWMEQFFIMRGFRRRGVGERVARTLFDRMPGTWEVAEIATNTGAQAFWRATIGRYTGGEFEEVSMSDRRWNGPVQYLRSNGAAS